MYVYMENDCLHTYYLEKYYQIPFKVKKYPLRDSEIPIALEDFFLCINYTIDREVRQ